MKCLGYFLGVFCGLGCSIQPTLAGEAIQSIYTSLDAAHCTTLNASQTEAFSSVQRCKGTAGYDLLVEDVDNRQTVTLITPTGQRVPLSFSQTITPYFSTLGKRAEWRIHSTQKPIALIIRIHANEDPSHPTKLTSYLSVTKITPTQHCVTHRIAQQDKMNERARQAADTAAHAPCLIP